MYSKSWGCIHSVHAREQGIWTKPRSRARPVRGSCRGPGPQTHGSWPFEVERKALRLGSASPQSEPAESGLSSPPQGDSPPPQELAARLERHQVSGRISISAPFHGKRGHRRHQIPQNFPHDLRPSAGAIFSVPHPYRVSQVRFLPGEQGCRGKQVRTYLRPQVRPLWAAARPHRPSRRLPPSAVVRWCRRADPGRISRAPRGRGPRGVRAARSARCCRRTAGSGRRPRRPTRASAWRPPSAPAFASRPPRSRSRALPCS